MSWSALIFGVSATRPPHASCNVFASFAITTAAARVVSASRTRFVSTGARFGCALATGIWTFGG